MVQGDPAAMRTAARRLHNIADGAQSMSAQLKLRADMMSFAGPAADRFRAQVAYETQRLVRAADQVASSADLLLRSADEVEEAKAREAAALRATLDNTWAREGPDADRC